MHSVQSELISKALTDMCLGDCENVSYGSKLSNNKLTEDPMSSSINFGDGNCGVARPAQHLLLNFAPDDEEDTESSQKKCCALWDFIKNTPEVQSALVSPDLELTKLMEEPIPLKSASSQNTESRVPLRTGVSIMSFVQKKGLIDPIFRTNTTKSKCSIGPSEYPHVCGVKKNSRKSRDCKCPCCSNSASLTDVQAIYSEMEKFDQKHPKSMDPPGHHPKLTHCILQRKADSQSNLTI